MIDNLERVVKLFTVEVLFLTAAALIGVLVLVAVLRRGADPADLIMGDDGKLSWTKVGACVGGTTLTWGFIHLVGTGGLTEWFFNGYGLIMFGTAFAYKANVLKSGILPQSTTRVDAPAGSSVKVDVQSGDKQ